ncbi:MAG: hypothetical protein WCA80_13245, partial [Candidatus Aquilonibacter sp.]
ENSLQYLTPDDVSALVAYLRRTSAQTGGKAFNIAPAAVASSNAAATSAHAVRADYGELPAVKIPRFDPTPRAR